MCRTISTMHTAEATASATTVLTVVTTEPILAHGMDTLRLLEVVRAADATFRAVGSYRFVAVRTDRPGSWTNSATTRSADGVYCEDFDTSATTDQMYVQGRIAASSTSGVAEALTKIQMSRDGEAKIVASEEINITPSTNSGDTSYKILAQVPAQDLASFMAACQARVSAGTLSYGFAYRVFEDGTDPEGTWTSLSSYTGITADELRNTGELSVTPGTNMFCQLAIKWGGTDAVATIRVLVSALWS